MTTVLERLRASTAFATAILQQTAIEFGTTVDTILSSKRDRRSVTARRAAALVLSQLTPHTHTKLATMLGFDRSSLSGNVGRAEALVSMSPAFSRHTKAIVTRCTDAFGQVKALEADQDRTINRIKRETNEMCEALFGAMIGRLML